MPELPEVQTIVNDLRRLIRGWTVAGFCSKWEKNISPGVRNFKKEIIEAKIIDVKRKGKYILIELNNGNVMVIHLRMTGALVIKRQEPLQFGGRARNKKQTNSKFSAGKHIHHWWVLRKDKKKMVLQFSDVRKFGTIDLLIKKKHDTHKGLCKLGSDPLSKKFLPEHFKNMLRKFPKRTIRSVLLDQCLIVGIGNIYASEILFDAKISPMKKAGKIETKEVKKLCGSIKNVLKKAIRLRGTSISDYRDSSGKQGSFQNILKVYNKEHEQCPRKGCRGVVVRKKLQQRSAFWCPKCQK